jgi:hypothetical protein
MCRLRAAIEFQNIWCGSKKIKTRSVGLFPKCRDKLCRQVSEPMLSDLVVFVCLSTGQKLLSSVWFKSCRAKAALSLNCIAHNITIDEPNNDIALTFVTKSNDKMAKFETYHFDANSYAFKNMETDEE